MRMTVSSAKAFAAALGAAATKAEAAKQTDFDLLDTLAAVDDEARAGLVAAIAAAEVQSDG